MNQLLCASACEKLAAGRAHLLGAIKRSNCRQANSKEFGRLFTLNKASELQKNRGQRRAERRAFGAPPNARTCRLANMRRARPASQPASRPNGRLVDFLRVATQTTTSNMIDGRARLGQTITRNTAARSAGLLARAGEGELRLRNSHLLLKTLLAHFRLFQVTPTGAAAFSWSSSVGRAEGGGKRVGRASKAL